MKFEKIYKDTQSRLLESTLGLWANGRPEMKEYLKKVFENEPLLGKPVFQNMFPWELAKEKFGDLESLFSKDFIDKLDKVNEPYEFPKERSPYVHQLKSWKTLLHEHKSVAVTTGTGSGKTESFMIPVLADLYKNCKNQEGVSAIFLYPLNALISSQEKRMKAWLQALGGLTYAVYNGETEETVRNEERENEFPKIIDRITIRETPPQILFTNPSMLELMLVRNKDVSLINKSKGKLRWILLDEAHTLKGSSATEIALLLRRVVEAFDVNIDDIRFAITSATVGSGEEAKESLKSFMANLCGIEKSNIVIIDGKRSLENITHFDIEDISDDVISNIRKSIYEEDFLTAEKITKDLENTTDLNRQLQLVDNLSEKDYSNKPLLPLKGHFFARKLNGLYSCVNSNCTKYHDVSLREKIGALSTMATPNCTECKYPMYEVVQCKDCGDDMFVANKIVYNSGDEYLSLVTNESNDFYENDTDEIIDEEEVADYQVDSRLFYFSKNNAIADGDTTFNIDIDGKKLSGGSEFVYHLNEKNGCVCGNCNNKINHPYSYRLPLIFLNRTISDVLLSNIDGNSTSNNKKYISFTDSREGTARISAIQNIETENNWVKSNLIQLLKSKSKVDSSINENIKYIEDELNNENLPQFRRNKLQQELNVLRNDMQVGVSWEELCSRLLNSEETKRLFLRATGKSQIDIDQLSNYAKALVYTNFTRRGFKSKNLENLGLVSLCYPDIENLQKVPDTIMNLISIEEWRDLLKFSIDFYLRDRYIIDMPGGVSDYITDVNLRHGFNITRDPGLGNVKQWPTLEEIKHTHNRLIFAIFGLLGLGASENFTDDNIVKVNTILNEIWNSLKQLGILKETANKLYRVDLYNKSIFRFSKKVWICPVSKNLIDIKFKSYSPFIKGKFKPSTYNLFIIENLEGITMPDLNAENSISLKEEFIKLGIWNDIYDKVLEINPIYLAAEHSAQIDSNTLRGFEDQFMEGNINILNCSTTMEMGVDIGGISSVLMNSVPPEAANYLQRAGRAGRRNEKKSFALTICPSNPIGMHTLKDPLQMIKKKIAPPYVSFDSDKIVYRHINAFLFGKFVQQDVIQGIRIRQSCEAFFMGDDSLSYQFKQWLIDLKDLKYNEEIKRIIKSSTIENSNVLDLIHKSIDAFDVVFNKFITKEKGYQNRLEEIRSNYGEEDLSYLAIQRQYNLFKDKVAFDFLIQEGYFPSGGLPTAIVEFNTINRANFIEIQNRRKFKLPSFHITRALTEFSPGKEIVINGLNYLSEGIVLRNFDGKATNREIIQECTNCNYQRIVETANNEQINDKCPECKNTGTLKGLNIVQGDIFTEMIEPIGFSVDFNRGTNRRINNSSSKNYIDPLLINNTSWEKSNSRKLEVREGDSNAEILYYNTGSGKGYNVCIACGRSEIASDANGTIMHNHTVLNGKANAICKGTKDRLIRRNVVLGGRLKTEYSEIRFKSDTTYVNDDVLLFTLGVIISKSLCEFLAIEDSEISFGLKKYNDYKSIFFFDTRQGGAGYSSQLSFYLNNILKAAILNLECDCKKSCTKCLIDRNTQWYINKLDRVKATEYLDDVIKDEIPEELKNKYPSIERVFNSFETEVNRLMNANQLKSIYFRVSSDIEAWNLSNNYLLKKLRRNDVDINFVFPNEIANVDRTITSILIKTSSWSNILYSKSTSEDWLATIELSKNKYINYTTDDILDNNHEDVLICKVNNLYKHYGKLLNMSMLDLNKALEMTDNMHEIVLNGNMTLKSTNLFNTVYDKITEETNLLDVLNKANVNIEYSDRYLKTPLACIIASQFLIKLCEKFNLEINNFNIVGEKIDNNYDSIRYINNQFTSSEDRDMFLKFLIEYNADIKNLNVNSYDKSLTIHNRYLKIENENLSIKIRIDGGISHGWKSDPYIEYEDVKYKDNLIDYDIDIEKIYGTDELIYTIIKNK